MAQFLYIYSQTVERRNKNKVKKNTKACLTLVTVSATSKGSAFSFAFAFHFKRNEFQAYDLLNMHWLERSELSYKNKMRKTTDAMEKAENCIFFPFWYCWECVAYCLQLQSPNYMIKNSTNRLFRYPVQQNVATHESEPDVNTLT